MQPGETIQDRYRLEHRLGNGGMAEVWKAFDTRLERPVAVKFVASALAGDPEFLVRFFAEAQSVAQISHPNVVAMLDFGRHQEHPFLIMEYIEGSLDGLAREPMEETRAADIVAQVARGAGAAHEQGIIHRDIKPGNILLTEDGVAKLADFGIATAAGGERLTESGAAIGSPNYLSPEQVLGEEVTPRSDVYALGIVLYELLAGARPFDGNNIAAVALAQVDVEPEDLVARGISVHPALSDLVMRCLSKDPDYRPADGNELAWALETIESPEATAAFAPQAPSPGGGLRLALLIGLAAVMVAGTMWVWAPPERAATGRSDPSENSGVRGPSPEPSAPSPDAASPPSVVDPSSSPTESPTAGNDDQPRLSQDEGASSDTSSSDGESTTSEPSPSPTPSPTPTE